VSPIDDPGILFTKKKHKAPHSPSPEGRKRDLMIVDFE